MPLFGNLLSHARQPHEMNGLALPHWTTLKDAKVVHIYGDDGDEDKDYAELEYWIPTDDQFYRTVLSPKEYTVLREQGTERPRSSVYDKFYPDRGHFGCRACGLPLYSYRTKFDSGTGWPSFGAHVEGNVATRPHYTCGMRREELTCRRCRSHLGHVFAEGNASRVDRLETYTERQCVNGICLKYRKESLAEDTNWKATALESP